VALQADVELGGTDQLFNLNVGRDIMPAFNLEPQVVMTVPLLVGLDGVEKMSKSFGNYVGINEPADVMAEKLVEQFRGSDEVLWTYFTLLTDLSPADIETLRREAESGSLSPTDLRYRLAGMVVTDFHGADAAAAAEQAVRARHAARISGEVVDDASLPVIEVTPGEDGAVALTRVIVDLKFAPSTSEATRQIKAGGVRINGERVAALRWMPPVRGQAYMLAVGGKKLAKLVLTS
jgi:tyrosyl-tRNA synthetase